MKNGQIEMIGLVMVVILIVISALLYLKFGILGKKEVKQETTIETSYVINTLTALTNIQICESNPIKFKDVVSACLNQQNICETEACNYLKTQTEIIMGSIGISNKYKYSLFIEKENNRIDIKKQCDFGTKADIKHGDQGVGYYTINLQIC